MSDYDVYFAASLFTNAEKAYNLALTHRIEARGLTVFLPQRDGLEFAALDGLSPEERNRQIFALDTTNVEGSRIIVAVLDGAIPDEGVAIELGTGKEHAKLTGIEKLILGLRTDTRPWQPGSPLNPMVMGTLDQLFTTEDDLIDYLVAHVHGTH